MSRSCKKTPGTCYRNPWVKNQANRFVRRLNLNGTPGEGGAYRREHQEFGVEHRRFALCFTKAAVSEHFQKGRTHQATMK